jgi:hypothetical protein
VATSRNADHVNMKTNANFSSFKDKIKQLMLIVVMTFERERVRQNIFTMEHTSEQTSPKTHTHQSKKAYIFRIVLTFVK